MTLMFYWQSMLLFSLKYAIKIKWLLKCDVVLNHLHGNYFDEGFFLKQKHILMVYYALIVAKV